MIVFGVDIPLIEIIFALGIISIIILFEIIIALVLLMRSLKKAKELTEKLK